MAATSIRTVQDEMRESLDRIKALVAQAEADDRDLTADEKREKDALVARMTTLDQKRQRGDSFDKLLNDVTRTALSASLPAALPPGRAGRAAPGTGTLGDALVASRGFQALTPQLPTDGPHRSVWELEGRAVPMLLASIQVPPPLPGPDAAPAPVTVMPVRVAALMPTVPVEDSPVSYWQFRGSTGGAAVVPVGTLKPPLVIDKVRLSGNLVTIAATIVVDDADIEDAPSLVQTLNAELAYDVLDALDAEILLGTGTGGRWLGLVPGATGPTRAMGAGETALDAIRAASALLYDASGRHPDSIVMNGSTYAGSVAVKAATSGVYMVPPVPYPIATYPGTNLRLALNPAMVDGQALLGSFAFGCKLDVKGGPRIDVSNSVADSFLHNQSYIRCELRAFLAITRPKAFSILSALPDATP